MSKLGRIKILEYAVIHSNMGRAEEFFGQNLLCSKACSKLRNLLFNNIYIYMELEETKVYPADLYVRSKSQCV